MWLFAALVGIPLIEIGLFIEVGGLIGLWPTLGIVVLTALVGTLLLRAQGTAAWLTLQRRLAAGDDPSGALAHGALILVAGIVLLTPGFFTDAVGLALLLPPVRAAVIRFLASRVHVVGTAGGDGRPPHGSEPDASETVIDADYEVYEAPGGGEARGGGRPGERGPRSQQGPGARPGQGSGWRRPGG